MHHLTDAIRAHLQSIVDRSGACAGSVFVSTPWNEAEPVVLVHTGAVPAVPELSDVDTANALHWPADSGSTAAGVEVGGGPRAVVPSREAGGVLIPIPLISTLWQRITLARNLPDDALRHLRRHGDRAGHLPAAGWIGLRFGDTGNPVGLEWNPALQLSSALASAYVCLYGALTDPLTGLPSRAELYGLLRAELERARSHRQPYALVFANPGSLDDVNARFGRAGGDSVIREAVLRLQRLLRRSDPILRYGGAVFAIGLSDLSVDAAAHVGEKIRRAITDRPFLDGACTLACHVGIGIYNPDRDELVEPLDLLRRADLALASARQAQGESVSVWRPGAEMDQVSPLDRLLGVFTGNVEKDYRNMGLLWNALEVVAPSADPEALARAVVTRLFELLRPERVAVFETKDAGALRVLAGLTRTPALGGGPSTVKLELLGPEEWELNLASSRRREPQVSAVKLLDDAEYDPPATAFSLPLLSGDHVLGTLFVAGRPGILKLDASDLPFLTGFAAQVAVALDRAQLADRQRASEERERRALKAELQDLRSALQQAKLVFRSQVMADVLTTTRRVAPTDATVLVTGESGTGKELLAHTLHLLSPRRQKPFVIVDCGAIPSTLIESELFGRERGAFTGAEQRSAGRLVQADGGTVFLDEIGELPLEVQSKLLRFVQEKQVLMVGSTRPQRMDVRIVAATNRDLEHEVRAGRFRQDLFYRLNVVRLRVPPLRERPDDVLFLARHFLEVFAVQYQKPVRRFTDMAECELTTYPWPGNVRELQNRVLQAVVLAEGADVTPHDLRLPFSPNAVPLATRAIPTQGAPPWEPEAVPRVVERSGGPRVVFPEAEHALRMALRFTLEATLGSSPDVLVPLGRWLAHDLVLEAYQAAEHVIARGAVLTGLPETTFARRLRQATADAAISRRPDSWPEVRAALGALLRATARPPENVLDHVEHLLLEEVLRRVPNNASRASQLVGLSLPTFRRRVDELRYAS